MLMVKLTIITQEALELFNNGGSMNVQMSRQDMFNEIQRLKRELADGAWEHVVLANAFKEKNEALNKLRDFINGTDLEITVGMALGADSRLDDASRVVSLIREEVGKLIVQEL